MTRHTDFMAFKMLLFIHEFCNARWIGNGILYRVNFGALRTDNLQTWRLKFLENLNSWMYKEHKLVEGHVWSHIQTDCTASAHTPGQQFNFRVHSHSIWLAIWLFQETYSPFIRGRTEFCLQWHESKKNGSLAQRYNTFQNCTLWTKRRRRIFKLKLRILTAFSLYIYSSSS